MEARSIDYKDNNEVFDKLMRSGNIGIGENTPEGCTDGGVGKLVVRTVTANGALPIEGARVTVFDTKNNAELTMYTDESGRTFPVAICVPPAKNSLTPGGLPTYGVCNILVEKVGYYTEEFLNVAIFDKIESIQNVSLEPLDEDAFENDRVDERIIVAEIPDPAVDMV